MLVQIAINLLRDVKRILVANSPDWLLIVSQLVVGVGLAAQFTAISLARFLRLLFVTLTLVSMFGVLACVFAIGLSRFVELPLPALILSFAPGGVTEMGLIALSLSLSPMAVATHHVFRIFMTTLLAAGMARFFLGKPETDP